MTTATQKKPTTAQVADLQAQQAETIERLEAELRELGEKIVSNPDEQAGSADPSREPRNVVEAVVEVMRRVQAVGKDSVNQHFNFNFRGIDAVLNAVGPAMREVGVLCLPGRHTIVSHDELNNRNKKELRHVLEVEYVFHYSNGDGEHSTLPVLVTGEAQDGGDKGITKAFSVALRTCLIQSLALPTTERDPDADSHENEAVHIAADEVQTALTALLEKYKDDPATAKSELIMLGDHYGKGPLSTIKLPGKDKDTLVAGDVRFFDLISYFEGKVRQAAEAPKQQADAAAAQAEDNQDPAPAADPKPEAEAAQKADPTPTAAAEPDQAPTAASTEATRDATEGAPVPAPEPEAKQQAQAATERAAANPPVNNRKAQMYKLANAEATAYAGILGKPLDEFLAPVFEKAKTENFDELQLLGQGGLQSFLVSRRPLVLEALRTAGRTDEADRLAKIGNTWPLVLDGVLGQ